MSTLLPINRYLDHAVLKPELNRAEAKQAIQIGIDYKVFTVCVRPCDIELAIKMCEGTETYVSNVLSFPHGIGTFEVKAAEARDYIAKGTKEIDMVVNYGFIRSAKWDWVEKDIRSVSEITKPAGVLLKVILETGMLTPDEIAKATEIAIKAEADFVKTSTGFNGGGATEEAIKIMLDTARGRIKVKPSGGVRDYSRAKFFLDMGVHRLGVNYPSTPIICNEVSEAKGTAEGY
jgi:deoxyribose-phosphate aldolase